MKNFVEPISIKFGGFTSNEDEFGSNLCCTSQAHQNIGGNSYIGRYSNGQISVGLLIVSFRNLPSSWSREILNSLCHCKVDSSSITNQPKPNVL